MVRIILSLDVLRSWHIHQLDVKNTFLNDSLSTMVFMEQHPGLIDPTFPDHAYLLKKALYGLHQAPPAWYQRFHSFLLLLGFVCSVAETSLFVVGLGSVVIYLLVYVEDIIVTGNDSSIVQRMISQLCAEFSAKDMGRLGYFLGLEVSYPSSGLFLNQSKYARDILLQANLLDDKSVSTPLAPGVSLVVAGSSFSDPTLYRSLIGL